MLQPDIIIHTMLFIHATKNNYLIEKNNVLMMQKKMFKRIALK